MHFDPNDGLPKFYNEARFEKVVSDEVLVSELERISEPAIA